jgi:hypothetical protein
VSIHFCKSKHILFVYVLVAPIAQTLCKKAHMAKAWNPSFISMCKKLTITFTDLSFSRKYSKQAESKNILCMFLEFVIKCKY